MVKQVAAESIQSKIGLVMKSGKACLGYKSTIKSIRNGNAKLVLISNNCPTVRKSEIEYYAQLAGINIHKFTGNNVDLGTTCGKLYRCSVMAVLDAGDSDILKVD
ncbi:hypothetical protein IMG5_158670 [Ichthyophthirius multifiliis]|uniref:Ribosomal protein eL8/eL30/eS12/Gadd45 domain-containing protein n=1 Tax=Ichthyophthirius multifiliis TaxID=5932 RepID=G0QZP2_ICHMU|nr:hypothetical protein IMG5_158670 [Ichthyophthirius multifiliis]EGR29316.1 hypothetical protein IMG5_158670 [Ichthyophthirius multifiliis]|eukprot:XP_004030552.1 hypothetical protein IMG5_158670 [Ichthyophthirius multifiliis]